jgi:2-hydroxychromene-2-carboxylate isomerase
VRQLPHVDCFVSTVSPFVYLAGTRLDEIAARHGATVAYHPLDVGALFLRTGGLSLKDRHPNRQAYRLQEMRRQARKAGLPINPHPRHWPVNGAPSAYAVIAAQAAGGKVGPLIQAFGRACWAEERDISDPGTIAEIMAAEGFDPALADRGMLTAAETYARNLEEAAGRGAFGVPFYITDGDERFWGQDRLDDLDAHLAGRL